MSARDAAAPPGPRGWPRLGVLPALRRDPLRQLLAIARAYPGAARLAPGWYLISHPDLVAHILVDHAENYTKGASVATLRAALGNGLITSEGDFWRRQRRLAAPAFQHRRLAGFLPVIVAAVDDLRRRWSAAAAGGEAEIDLAAEMRRLTLDVVGRTLLSTPLGGTADRLAPAITAGLEVTNRRFWSLVKAPPWWPSRDRRRFARALGAVDEVVWGILAARRRDGGGHDDLLASLLAARDEETGEPMSDQQLRDEIITLLIAGHDSTSQSLAWTFYLLDRHPEVRRQVEEEVEHELAGRPPGTADLPRLRRTTSVLLEALRLYPPAWLLSRSPRRDDRAGGFALPAGAVLLLSPYVTHRLEEFWPQAEHFAPERFRDPRRQISHRLAYFPFGAGPRVCIGNSFALLEAQLILTMLLQRFELRLVAGHPVEVQAMMALRPRFGLRCRFRERGLEAGHRRAAVAAG